MKHSLFLLILVSFSVFGQPHLNKHYVFRQFSTYDGLVQSQVNRIVQDSKGYLWICTKGGLGRFDGVRFQNFVDTKDGGRINIQNIVETGNGFIVSTVTKLFRFTYEEENPEKWQFEDLEIPGGYLHYTQSGYFYNDSDNSIYLFNTKKYGWGPEHLFHFKYNFTSKTIEPLPIGDHPILFSFQKNGDRYYLSGDRIYLFRNGKFNSQILPGKYDTFALSPRDSTIFGYQQSSKTIVRFGDNFQECTPVCKNISIGNYVLGEPNTFIINSSGQFIFLDNNHLLRVLNGSGTEVVASLNFLHFLCIGRENNLWVGTEEGLFNFFSLDFEQSVFNISRSIDNVWSLACAPDSTMWFGGFGTGLWSLNKEGKIRTYKNTDFKIPAADSSLFKGNYMGGITDREGRIYIPCAKGMLVIDRNSLKYRGTKNVPMAICDDPDRNRLILAKISGVEIVEKGNLKTILDIDSPHNFVSCCTSRDGKPLLGTFQRQFKLEGDSLLPYPSAKNLGVISMVKDHAGNIWKGTPVGLYLDDGKTETEILPDLIKGSIAAVFIKRPWLMATTVKELFLINLDDFYTKGSATAYKFGPENGYFSMDGGQNGFCRDNEGRVWYTVTDKVLHFSPDSLARHYNPCLPKPHFASVSFSKNGIDWIRVAPGDTSDLVREHFFNSLRFTMIAISETQPEKVTYQYRIKGMSDEWSQATRTSQQSFTNLRPGDYQIEIRSSIDGKNWSDIVSSQRIKIKRAWWQSWWAYLIAVALFGALIAFLVNYFLKKKQELTIRKLMEQKRLNELRLQSVRSKNIPHFSGNALANIEHFIFNADLRQANKFLTRYSRLMNITLRDADLASRSVERELEYVTLYLELEKMRFGDRLEYSVKVDPSVNQKIALPNMLMQTWVENAIKHGVRHKEGIGKILILITDMDSERVLVCVEDNGVGRTKAKELGTSGTGQGLKILAEQIAIYNQVNTSKIVVTTTDLVSPDGTAEGTRFEMAVPVVYRFDIN